MNVARSSEVSVARAVIVRQMYTQNNKLLFYSEICYPETVI